MMNRLSTEHTHKQEEQSLKLELEQQEKEIATVSPPATGNKQWKALYQELSSYAEKLRNSNKR